jgi:hypothetical protein
MSKVRTLRKTDLSVAESSGNSVRKWDVACQCVFALLIVLTAYPALINPEGFLQDDSYFYLQIASNIVAGHGSTFHQFTPTNGYHPLWLWLTTVCMGIAGGDKAIGLQVVMLFQVGLFVATVLVFRRVARMMNLRYWSPGFAIVAVYLLGTGVYGSEAHLSALMLITGIAFLWQAINVDSIAAWLISGFVFGLAILARLDNLFVAFALIGFAILHDGRPNVRLLARRTLTAALGGALVVLPYLGYNYLIFGYAMPISGAIKSIFPSILIDFNNLGEMGRVAAPFGAVVLFIGLVMDGDARRRVVWLGLGTGVVLHTLYVVAYTDHYTFWAWYYVSGVIAAGFSMSYLAGWISTRIRMLVPENVSYVIVSLAAVVLLSLGAARAWFKGVGPIQMGPIDLYVQINDYRWPNEVGRWLKENLPPGSSMFVYDYPGGVAFFSDLRLLPMDGLVNDFRYNDELLTLGVNRYLCSHAIQYYFGPLERGSREQIVPVTAPLTRLPAGSLRLRPEDIVVRTRDFLSRPEEALDFAVWKLSCPAS